MLIHEVTFESRFSYTCPFFQPNLKYSLQVSSTGLVKYYKNATEYILHVATRTPFLEYAETELNSRLKIMTESRINSDVSLRLNNKLYTLYLKGTTWKLQLIWYFCKHVLMRVTCTFPGILNPFEKTKLCLHLTTPYEKYQDVSGILFYDPEEKHVFVNLTSGHFEVRTDIIYVYNNLSNFNLKLHVVTPMSYLSRLVLVGMYNGKAVSITEK